MVIAPIRCIRGSGRGLQLPPNASPPAASRVLAPFVALAPPRVPDSTAPSPADGGGLRPVGGLGTLDHREGRGVIRLVETEQRVVAVGRRRELDRDVEPEA